MHSLSYFLLKMIWYPIYTVIMKGVYNIFKDLQDDEGMDVILLWHREKAPIEMIEKVKRMTLHVNKVKNIKLNTSLGEREKYKTGEIELDGLCENEGGFS